MRKAVFGDEVEYVDVEVIVPAPLRPEPRQEVLARGDFMGAPDKVGRPTGRGKLARTRTSSDEFAKRKQEEIELEERSR